MNGIVFKEVVSSHNMNWEQEAESLARAGIPFVLVGFSYSHDISFYEQLKLQFALNARFDPDKQRAYFWGQNRRT